MQQVSFFLNTLSVKKEKPLNERQSILKDIQEKINLERIGTKFKKLSGRAIAMKVAHMPTQHLYYLDSICRDYKNRKGSYSKCFFGSIKAVDKSS